MRCQHTVPNPLIPRVLCACGSVHCQLLDRSQCRLDLVLVPLALFVTDDASPGPPPPPAPPVQVLLSSQTDVWINVSPGGARWDQVWRE